MNRFTDFLLLCCFHIAFIQPLSSQNVNQKLFTKIQGLPSQEVYDVFQDENGLVWFSTDRGIASFDGNQMKKYSLEDGLTNSTVFRFYPQENGEVWCTTYGRSLFYFRSGDYKMIPYEYNEVLKNNVNQGVVNQIYIDSEGAVHVSFIERDGVVSISSKGKLLSTSRMDRRRDSTYMVMCLKDNLQHITYLIENKEELPEQDLKRVVKIAYPNAFIKSARSKSFEVMADKKHVYFFQKGKHVKTIKTKQNPIGVGVYDDEHFWVGYLEGGVVVYDLNLNATQSFFPTESVSDLMIDHVGGIWISTLSSGVFYKPGSANQKYKFGEGVGVTSLTVDIEKSLYVGLRNGNCLQFSGKEIIPINESGVIRPLEVQFYNGLNTLLSAGDFHLWDVRKDERVVPGYWSVMSDDPYQLPLLSVKGAIGVVDKSFNLSKYKVGDVVYDASANGHDIFFGTNDGLYQFDTLTRKKKKLFDQEIDCRISDIDNVSEDVMILGTMGNGVWLVKGEEILYHIRQSEGLSNNFVNEVYVEDDHTFWVCTILGLNCIVIDDEGNYEVFNAPLSGEDLENDITNVVVIQDSVWVGTKGGLYVFRKERIFQKREPVNHFLRIVSIYLNDQEIDNLNVLDHDQNNINITLGAVSFAKGDTLQFRYRLKEQEPKWNYTYERMISYQSLPPGEYTLLIEAGIQGRFEDNHQQISFVILPPFYQRLWFKLTVLVCITSLIYLFFRFRVLVYNQDILRELLRQTLKRITPKTTFFTVRENGKTVKIDSRNVLFVKSYKNYIEIHTTERKVVVREKISNFTDLVPDPIEYLRIHRSYIIRIDHITEKSVDTLTVGTTILKVGNTYLPEMKKIHL